MAWTQLTPSLPTELTEASQLVADGLSSVKTALRLARERARIANLLATRDVTGALAAVDAVVASVVSAVESALSGLLDSGGAYVLLVPMPKKGLTGFIGTPVTAPSDAPVGALEGEVPGATSSSLVWQDAFASNRLFLGGNAHYLKTVVEALFDGRDANRPQFGNTTYWGYAALVAGASDVTACLALATYIDQLFGNPQGSGALRASRGDGDIVAQGVRVRASERSTGAVVEWSPLDPHALSDGSARIDATEYAVFRSSKLPAMTATTVLDLFGDVAPAEGATGAHGAVVLTVSRYNGYVHRYVDPGPLDPETTYYYHVAVRTRMVDSVGITDLGYRLLSSAARYRPEERVSGGTHGKAPDWWRTPSVARLFPSLERFLDRVLESVRGVQAVTTRGTTLSTATLESIERQIARLDRLVGELDLLLSQLEKVFNAPNAGIHVDLQQGQGSVSTLITVLSNSLSDFSDVDRPPFDNGDEYVTGAIVVVSAPDETAFLRIWALLQLIFGADDGTDPVIEGLRSIGDALTPATAPLTDAPPPVTFNPDMSPRPSGSGDSSCE